MSNVKKLMMTAAGGSGPNVEELFSTVVYDGEGTNGKTVTTGLDVANEGGIAWIKCRNQANDNIIIDPQKYPNGNYWIYVNEVYAAQSIGQNIFSFSSTGWSVADGLTNSDNPRYNASREYVSWNFRQASNFFDAVAYTGNGTAGREIAHNLGCAPGFIIVKRLDSATNWRVWHRTQTGKVARINLNDAFATENGSYFGNNNTPATIDPTASVFTVGSHGDVNASGGEYVAYLWAHNNNDGGFGETGDKDIIKCGSYTGGSGNTEIDLGFEPQWLLIKRADSAEDYLILDTIRGLIVSGDDVSYAGQKNLLANTSATEEEPSYAGVTPLPNGFKVRTGLDALYSSNGGTYVYVAIRRGPMATPTSASDVFDIFEQTSGNGVGFSTISATDPPFPIDFLLHKWHKSNREWDVMDRIRGSYRFLQTNGTNAEQNEPGWLDDIDRMQGYKAGSNGGVFYGTPDSIGYFWKRAHGYFDIVAWEGNNTAGRSISHNLGVVPEMIWCKNRQYSGGEDWVVYHKGMNGGTDPEDYVMYLNQNSSESNVNRWYDFAPTNTIFKVSADRSMNGNVADGNRYIAYLFATVDGVSKVGSYSGNGGTSANGNGQDIDCGFSNGARFVIIKPTNAADNWFVYDTTRGIVAGNDATLQLNLTSAQSSTSDEIDPLNAGFRILNQNNQLNRTGRNYIFYAIAA